MELDERYDNTAGNPIFQPLVTGDRLQGDDLQDWIAFSTALVAHNERYYNTWIENRYYRQNHDYSRSAVKAEAHDGFLCIRCPSKVWAHYAREALTADIRRLTKRSLLVLGPNEHPPKRMTEDERAEAARILAAHRSRRGHHKAMEGDT